MRWTERQRAMLREMGIELVLREAAPDDESQSGEAVGAAGGGAHARAARESSGAGVGVIGRGRRMAGADATAAVGPSRAAAGADPHAGEDALSSAPVEGHGDPRAGSVAARAAGGAAGSARDIDTHAPAPAQAPPRPQAQVHSKDAVAVPREADWLFVGDAFAEGGDEARLLDNMLHAIGVSRAASARARRAAFAAVGASGVASPARGAEAASVSSAVAPAASPAVAPGASPALAPDGSSAVAFGASPGGSLEASIGAIQPRCIVALGRSAATALLGGDGVLGELRGRVHRVGGVPVVVTFAHAYLLRHPAEKAKAWADLCLAVRTLEDAPG